METITYLVASYDCAGYVMDCVESLTSQTSDRWTAIICDDCSTDGSADVLRSVADSRINVIRNENNLGYVRTLQRLIDEAETDIVGILDADDGLFPQATAEIMRIYDTRRDAEFVHSSLQVFDENLTRGREIEGLPVPPGSTSLERGYISHLKTFRKSAYARTAGLDPDMLYAEDRDLVHKLEEVAEPIFVDQALYKYRCRPFSQTQDFSKRKIGAANAARAKRDALSRRNIHGLDRALHGVIIQLERALNTYPLNSIRREVPGWLWGKLCTMDAHLHIRSTGALRRKDRIGTP